MSKTNDLTRRLIADFFAARLEPRRRESNTPRPLHQDAESTDLPHGEQDSSRMADLGDPGGSDASEVD
jgi:hypothetical protein